MIILISPGSVNRKPNRNRVFWKTETETDVGFSKTEKYRKPTPKNRKKRFFGFCLPLITNHKLLKQIQISHRDVEDVVARIYLVIPSTYVASERVKI